MNVKRLVICFLCILFACLRPAVGSYDVDFLQACKVKPDLFKGVQFCLCDDVENAETVSVALFTAGLSHRRALV